MSDIEISIEFFPPKTEKGFVNFRHAHKELASLNPGFFSVTFGAGGSTRDGTLEAVREIMNSGHRCAPHISCVASSRNSVAEMLDQYRELGVSRIVALRGDRPSGMVERGDFDYASDLVSFIREREGDDLRIEVAAYPEFHPESKSPETDIANFKRKIDAGANSAITQYFFNADAYFAYVDAVRSVGVDVLIVPGIMPITNFTQLARFSDTCGAEIPRWLRARLEQYKDDLPSLVALGTDVITALCERLLAGGAPGMHFYSLNKSQPTIEICHRLGLGLGLAGS
jgi:methylenetetrahydrofolate reductase (NADPH)